MKIDPEIKIARWKIDCKKNRRDVGVTGEESEREAGEKMRSDCPRRVRDRAKLQDRNSVRGRRRKRKGRNLCPQFTRQFPPLRRGDSREIVSSHDQIQRLDHPRKRDESSLIFLQQKTKISLLFLLPLTYSGCSLFLRVFFSFPLSRSSSSFFPHFIHFLSAFSSYFAQLSLKKSISAFSSSRRNNLTSLRK